MFDTTPQHAPSVSHSAGLSRVTRAGIVASVLLLGAVPVAAVVASYPAVAAFAAALAVVVGLFRSPPETRTVPLTVAGLAGN
jgi:hypothetical protein